MDNLAAIVSGFTHEISLVISAYGGYVLNYLGDVILAFFAIPDDNDNSSPHMPCTNAVYCARSMITAVKEGLNVILNQEGSPDLEVRIGIDVGENVVGHYGWDIHSMTIEGKRFTIRKARHNILGYTISIVSKITRLAKPNQIVIGQYVYEQPDEQRQNAFNLASTPPETWSYTSSKIGKLYSLYASK